MKKILVFLTMMFCFMSIASAEVIEDNYITVTEYGLPHEKDTQIGAKKLHARRAAIINGYKAILEEAKGVSVDGYASVRDLAFSSEITNARIEGAIKNAKVIAEEWNAEDETFMVTLRMPIFGSENSLAKAVLEPTRKETFARVSDYTDTPPITNGRYTGVVIDCSAFNLPTAMSPVIYDEAMTPIYGYKNLDYDYVVANGMVGYSHDVNEHPRAGANPIFVTAIGVNGASPIITKEDAAKILAENEKSGFLTKTSVTFVR